jgi:hypothetical protein
MVTSLYYKLSTVYTNRLYSKTHSSNRVNQLRNMWQIKIVQCSGCPIHWQWYTWSSQVNHSLYQHQSTTYLVYVSTPEVTRCTMDWTAYLLLPQWPAVGTVQWWKSFWWITMSPLGQSVCTLNLRIFFEGLLRHRPRRSTPIVGFGDRSSFSYSVRLVCYRCWFVLVPGMLSMIRPVYMSNQRHVVVLWCNM